MFPHYILSKRNAFGKYVTLWQLADYHYEVEYTGGETFDLPETPYEDALRIFQKHTELMGAVETQ